ncbi:MAG: hypothetical protein ACI865_000989 [Flavobacteriaceae bacterium]|jgi:hypothetical protein
MITSIEIVKMLQRQQKDYKVKATGFDAGLIGLGVARKLRKKDAKKTVR